MKLPISSSFSSEPRDSEPFMIPIIESGNDLPPVYLSVFTMENDIKPSKKVSSGYYLNQLLTKAEARNYLGCSDTSLDRISKEYPIIKTKIPKTGSILYIRTELDKVISGDYD